MDEIIAQLKKPKWIRREFTVWYSEAEGNNVFYFLYCTKLNKTKYSNSMPDIVQYRKGEKI